MLKNLIFIPVTDIDTALEFYSTVMEFRQDDIDFYPFADCDAVCLRLQCIDSEKKETYVLQEGKLRFPIFRYEIAENFLSYCDAIRKRGARFEMLCSHPGGYLAKVIDPSGNTFEIDCASWNEIAPVDFSNFEFYKRY